MNMNTKLLELVIVIAAGMLVIIGSMSALAQASGYKCTIKHSLQLENDGSTQPHHSADVYRNKEFIVDRASGRVLGDISYQVWNHQVLDTDCQSRRSSGRSSKRMKPSCSISRDDGFCKEPAKSGAANTQARLRLALRRLSDRL
jgi:hypothetical protein